LKLDNILESEEARRFLHSDDFNTFFQEQQNQQSIAKLLELGLVSDQLLISYFLTNIASTETEHLAMVNLWVALFEKNRDNQHLIESGIRDFFIKTHKWKELIGVCDLAKQRGLDRVYEFIIDKLTCQIILDLNVYRKKSKEALMPEEEFTTKMDARLEEAQRWILNDLMLTDDTNNLVSDLATHLPRVKVDISICRYILKIDFFNFRLLFKRMLSTSVLGSAER